ncbi:BEACH domain-containing lvsC [Gossypium australe]|uniref:BEACH domain-containing lvsC n=1 Tax=Gossypium australe TaxID=47621 RepID=A0A5B6WTB2_9ROSI|nr:BEACH domain-containing lvsC [Gossypium australe]
MFCFGCGRLGQSINDCLMLTPAEKEKVRDDSPYSIALKAETKVVGKESLKFQSFVKKVRIQRNYIGDSIEQDGQGGDTVMVAKDNWEEGLKEQGDNSKGTEAKTLEGNNVKGESSLKEQKWSTWKRLLSSNQLDYRKFENIGVKRKGMGEVTGQEIMEVENIAGLKKLKNEDQIMRQEDSAGRVCVEGIQDFVRRLRHLLKQQNPRLVFLMETKLDKKRIEKVRRSCGLVNGIEVEVEGTR